MNLCRPQSNRTTKKNCRTYCYRLRWPSVQSGTNSISLTILNRLWLLTSTVIPSGTKFPTLQSLLILRDTNVIPLNKLVFLGKLASLEELWLCCDLWWHHEPITGDQQDPVLTLSCHEGPRAFYRHADGIRNVWWPLQAFTRVQVELKQVWFRWPNEALVSFCFIFSKVKSELQHKLFWIKQKRPTTKPRSEVFRLFQLLGVTQSEQNQQQEQATNNHCVIWLRKSKNLPHLV